MDTIARIVRGTLPISKTDPKRDGYSATIGMCVGQRQQTYSVSIGSFLVHMEDPGAEELDECALKKN